MSSDLHKKYKRPKKKTLATTKPETSTSSSIRPNYETYPTDHECPLLAKDSEWVDILQPTEADPNSTRSEEGGSDEEEVLQLVDCEDGPQMKPLAIMFPGLLDKDPQTLHGMLNRAMSTTEVTKQLVDLGQKANFTFMKKTDRLIPPDRQWLESLTENSNSVGSLGSSLVSARFSSSNEASDEMSLSDTKMPRRKKKPMALSKLNLSHPLRLQDPKQPEGRKNCED